MPRICTVCVHEERADIETAMVQGTAKRRIAAHYAVSEQAVRRHMKEHLPAVLARGREAEEVARADDLIEKIRDLQERTTRLLDKAEIHGKWHSAFVGVGQYRQNIELLARLVGELQETPQVQVNIMASDEWLRIRSVMVQALSDFPEARCAVAVALAKLGGDSS